MLVRRTMTKTASVILAVLLGGCEPAAYWNGVGAPQRVVTDDHVVDVPVNFVFTRGAPLIEDEKPLRSALEQAAEFGTPSVEIVSPPAADPAFTAALAQILSDSSVPPDRVRQVKADAKTSGFVVRVHAIAMTVPPCAGIPTDSVSDLRPLALRKYELGCASAQNFAAMVADPRDLAAQPSSVGADGVVTSKAINTLRSGTKQKQAAGQSAGSLAGASGPDAGAGLGSGGQ